MVAKFGGFLSTAAIKSEIGARPGKYQPANH